MSESEMEVGGNGEASGGAAGAEADLSTQRLLPRGIPGSGSITAMERGGIAKEDVPDQPSDDDTDTDDDEEDGEVSAFIGGGGRGDRKRNKYPCRRQTSPDMRPNRFSAVVSAVGTMENSTGACESPVR